MFEEFFKDFFTSLHGWITIIFIIIILTLLVGLVKQLIPEDDKNGRQGDVIIVNQQTGERERRHHRDRDDRSERS
ncbi:hypothetical protein M153_6500022864 [Pseudoloma neurophilia]|uniref:Uncharacterized protein n=1 Tax=Pseudoloma neurophilia TaxID=146866 RepID=A0A0R0M0K5_9MICR|nr:hypothetical protein M153_6500022864 [Pseudoloma neurophilia]